MQFKKYFATETFVYFIESINVTYRYIYEIFWIYCNGSSKRAVDILTRFNSEYLKTRTLNVA